MELLTTDGTLCAVKVACTVWSEGKPGDKIKRLPIAIRHCHYAVHGAVDMVPAHGGETECPLKRTALTAS